MSTSAATPSRSFGKGNPKSIQNQLCLSPVVKAMTQLRVERQRKARRETENMCVCTRSHNHILACLVSLFREAGFQACTLLSPGFSTLRISIQSMIMWRTCIPSTCALDLHGSADNPSLNGTLRRQDLDLALSQRAQAKVDKYGQGYAAPGLRHAFLPAIVSTSGRIHGEYCGFSSTSPAKRPTTTRPPTTTTTSWPLVRPSMLNLRFTAGVGVGISGACGPPLVWRARKPLA